MKRVISKTCLSIFVLISMLFVFENKSYAASYSVSVSKRTVTAGENVKVTVNGNGCEGSFRVSASNGASVIGNNPIWTGESTTVKAGSSNFTITVSPSSVADSNTGESIKLASKSISVSIKKVGGSTPSNTGSSNNSGTTNNGGTTSKPVVDNRSKVNTLSSLSVSNGELSPKFSSTKTSYTLNLTSEVESLTINAKATDAKATVSGIGKKALKIGTQAFEIMVKAENGSKKSYIINVNVEEKPTVFTEYGNQRLGLLQSTNNIKIPDGYKGTTIELEGQTVSAWTNEKSGLTLVYLMNEKNEKKFYIVENKKVVSEYQVIKIFGKEYTLLTIPKDLKKQESLKLGKVNINDLQLECWTYEDKTHQNYSIVYLMNSNGEKKLYSYEATEGTLQLYTPFEEKTDNTLSYVFMGTTALFAITSLAMFIVHSRFKKKSISAIKDYYESRNID